MSFRKNGETITADWFNSVEQALLDREKTYDIESDQPATALAGQSFDGAKISSVIFDYEAQISTSIFATGEFAMHYLNGSWRLADKGFTGEDHGLTFTIDQDDTIGSLEVAGGGLGDGKLKLKRRTFSA